MASTYEKIATTTLGSSASSTTFSSISSAYTDLVLVIDYATTVETGVTFRFNSDTGSNYSVTYLVGSYTNAAISGRASNVDQINPTYWGQPTSDRGNIILQLNNYSNTTTYKSGLFRVNSVSRETIAAVGLWRSTSAITSITAISSFASTSTFTLYGIKAA